MAITEKDFLPAALEILEKPASPIGRFTIWMICLFFTIALTWSIVGKVDVVAVGQGKTVPIGQIKTIQSFEPGVVLDIFVENGSRVEKGDLLIKLDPTRNDADIVRIERELRDARLAEIRLTWVLSQLGQEINDGLNLDLGTELPRHEKEMQSRMAESRVKELKSTWQSIEEAIQEKRYEKKVSQSQLAKLQQTLPYLEEQAEALKSLAEEGVASRFQYLEKQEAMVSHKKDMEIEVDRQKQIDASIRSLESQLAKETESAKLILLQELLEAQSASVSLSQELIKAQKTNTLLLIRSPVTGVVQQLAIHTVGGVVRSSDPLMVIVPEERELQVEMNILNKDIGFVSVGQEVEVKLEAFPFTKYGIIPGKLLSIDSDAVNDENLGLIYPARVKLKKESILVDDNEVDLTPGMGLSGEIKIGQRRLIEFILSPLFRYKQESLRER